MNRSSSLLALVMALALVPGLSVQPLAAQSLLPGGGWSGPYWGLTGGGALADARAGNGSSHAAWSGHIGYGLNIGSLYLGGEADATWGGARNSSTITPLYQSELEVDWSTTLRARAGLTVAGALFYLTAGGVWSGQTLAVHSLGNELSSESKIIPGLVYGAGVELKVLPFVSARLEALRYDYSSQAGRFGDGLPAALTATNLKGIDLDEVVVRAGISLRLN